uniref:Uncharacterized protein n=1 Tax=Chrysotila carterae TaxID=13221 RepID=A0A7S4BEB6_CHRCT
MPATQYRCESRQCTADALTNKINENGMFLRNAEGAVMSCVMRIAELLYSDPQLKEREACWQVAHEEYPESCGACVPDQLAESLPQPEPLPSANSDQGMATPILINTTSSPPLPPPSAADAPRVAHSPPPSPPFRSLPLTRPSPSSPLAATMSASPPPHVSLFDLVHQHEQAQGSSALSTYLDYARAGIMVAAVTAICLGALLGCRHLILRLCCCCCCKKGRAKEIEKKALVSDEASKKKGKKGSKRVPLSDDTEMASISCEQVSSAESAVSRARTAAPRSVAPSLATVAEESRSACTNEESLSEDDEDTILYKSEVGSRGSALASKQAVKPSSSSTRHKAAKSSSASVVSSGYRRDGHRSAHSDCSGYSDASKSRRACTEAASSAVTHGSGKLSCSSRDTTKANVRGCAPISETDGRRQRHGEEELREEKNRAVTNSRSRASHAYSRESSGADSSGESESNSSGSDRSGSDGSGSDGSGSDGSGTHNSESDGSRSYGSGSYGSSSYCGSSVAGKSAVRSDAARSNHRSDVSSNRRSDVSSVRRATATKAANSTTNLKNNSNNNSNNNSTSSSTNNAANHVLRGTSRRSKQPPPARASTDSNSSVSVSSSANTAATDALGSDASFALSSVAAMRLEEEMERAAKEAADMIYPYSVPPPQRDTRRQDETKRSSRKRSDDKQPLVSSGNADPRAAGGGAVAASGCKLLSRHLKRPVSRPDVSSSTKNYSGLSLDDDDGGDDDDQNDDHDDHDDGVEYDGDDGCSRNEYHGGGGSRVRLGVNSQHCGAKSNGLNARSVVNASAAKISSGRRNHVEIL